ncbi:Putative histone H4, histone-fold [Septoria linicola]|uniref:Histone H4 n=1 Tax=Septoria linicola TaxID=215465 RepID=A0A9Q9AWW7_9PEZI|nr:putative histone H4, histone-fold [Septoria linicola]USW56929.1 Putative histone H4, histone-fold [Septoria linicola]
MAQFRQSNAPALLRSDIPSATSSARSRVPPTPSSSNAHRTPASSRPAAYSTGGKQGYGGKTSGSTTGSRGLGLGGKGLKRHRKILSDNIQGVTKGDIRRLARRGGVKRIAGTIYQETRSVLRKRLEVLLQDICAVVECSGRKTVCVTDVVFVLNRHGRPIYGFGDGQR